MKRNTDQSFFSKHLFLIALGFLALGCCGAHAEAMAHSAAAAQNSDNTVSNIGFIKDTPRTLTDKFPMCDEFLKVHWINKDKKIGYSRYTAFFIKPDGGIEDKEKTMWALVYLDDINPSYTLDIYEYVKENNMSKLFDMVDRGEIVRVPAHFAIKYNGKVNVFYDLKSPVIGGHKGTVCIPYPDGKKVWIIEGRRVADSASGQEYDALRSLLAGAKDSFVKRLLFLDVNFDGVSDFVYDGIYRSLDAIVYSDNGGLSKVTRTVVGQKYVLSNTGGDKKCVIDMDGRYPITSDGENYYISGTCNLTDLTSHN